MYFKKIIIFLSLIFFVLNCGDNEFNIFKPLAKSYALKNNPNALIEEAKILLDKNEYQDAIDLIEPTLDNQELDSNDTRLLYAAAKLGVSKLNLWSLIKTAIENTTTQSKTTKTTGIDGILDSFTDSILGTGDEKEQRLAALNKSISVLQNAPNPKASKITNTNCLLSGILAIPSLSNAKSGLSATQTALQSIADSATNGGSTCPNLSDLDNAGALITEAVDSFTLVLDIAKSCTFLSLDETEDQMNKLQQSLDKITSAADKGCASLPTCPSEQPNCQELFPTCVQEAMSINSSNPAVAGDGKIAQCEIVLHCSNPSDCFSI